MTGRRLVPSQRTYANPGYQHAALAVPCRHCGASIGRPCRLPSRRALLPVPHPSRQRDAHLVATRTCPACHGAPGAVCQYDTGRPFPGIHPGRADS